MVKDNITYGEIETPIKKFSIDWYLQLENIFMFLAQTIFKSK